VILVGDAAHVFPPFGGQGIASGFRDASSLAWRLAVLCREPNSNNHDRVLAAWYTERKQQLEKSLAVTIRNGEYVTEKDPVKAFVRDWYLWAVQLVPSWRRELEKGPRGEGMSRYRYESGMPFLPDLGGGICLPQVYCALLDSDQNAVQIRFTDDLIFGSDKRGLFHIVVLADQIEEALSAAKAMIGLSQLSHGLLHENEATFIVHDLGAKPLVDMKLDTGQQNIVRVATGEEFAADPMLCKNRPPPKYYDPYRMKHEVRGKKFVIVRPDRFVYAACSNAADLRRAVEELSSSLQVLLDGEIESTKEQNLTRSRL